MAIAQRYLADSAIDTAVSVGHRLINFVARVARTAPETRAQFSSHPKLRLLGDNYIPFVTEDYDAWLSLNIETVKSLRKTIPECHSRSVTALKELADSTAWKALCQVGAENFHRWRKEHESVVGIDKDSGRADNIYDYAGNVVGRGFRATLRRHTAGDGMTTKSTVIAGAGVIELGIAVEAIITGTLELLPALTGGFTLEIDGHGHTRRMSMPIFLTGGCEARQTCPALRHVPVRGSYRHRHPAPVPKTVGASQLRGQSRQSDLLRATLPISDRSRH